jgi:hypothetical protein
MRDMPSNANNDDARLFPLHCTRRSAILYSAFTAVEAEAYYAESPALIIER